MDNVKPGYKTSEFWLAAVVAILSLITSSGVLTPGSPWEKLVGLAAAALVSLNYTNNRINIKSAVTTAATPLLLVGLLLMGGCQSSQQAVAATGSVQASLTQYQGEIGIITDKLVGYYVSEERGKADSLADAAVKAETRPDGSAVATNVRVIEQMRLSKYAAIDAAAADIRAKIAAATVDLTNSQSILAGLNQYFTAKQSASDSVTQSEQVLIQLLQQYLQAKTQPGGAVTKPVN